MVCNVILTNFSCIIIMILNHMEKTFLVMLSQRFVLVIRARYVIGIKFGETEQKPEKHQ